MKMRKEHPFRSNFLAEGMVPSSFGRTLAMTAVLLFSWWAFFAMSISDGAFAMTVGRLGLFPPMLAGSFLCPCFVNVGNRSRIHRRLWTWVDPSLIKQLDHLLGDYSQTFRQDSCHISPKLRKRREARDIAGKTNAADGSLHFGLVKVALQ